MIDVPSLAVAASTLYVISDVSNSFVMRPSNVHMPNGYWYIVGNGYDMGPKSYSPKTGFIMKLQRSQICFTITELSGASGSAPTDNLISNVMTGSVTTTDKNYHVAASAYYNNNVPWISILQPCEI